MYILLFQKNDITKFLWGRVEGITPQLFGRGGDRPYRPHGVGAHRRRRRGQGARAPLKFGKNIFRAIIM